MNTEKPKVVKVLDGFRIPPGSVYVGRDKRYGDAKWGNPFRIGKDGTREEVIEKYRAYYASNEQLKRDLHELCGKDLACHCAPLACHADMLLWLARDLAALERSRLQNRAYKNVTIDSGDCEDSNASYE
jgi:hypothetical protein